MVTLSPELPVCAEFAVLSRSFMPIQFVAARWIGTENGHHVAV